MVREVVERRKIDRIDTDSAEEPLSMELMDAGVSATLKNISLTGLACSSLSLIPEMTVVKIKIHLPALPQDDQDYYPLECQGAVVRCEPVPRGNSRRKWMLAIYFTEIDELNRRLLERYIACRS